MDDPENDSSDSRIEDFPELPPNAFLKNDRAPDTEFYAVPRYVTHIDGNAIAAVMALYRELFPARGSVLGHGLNTEELAANGQLTSFFVKDLNADPQLPLESRSFDAAAICVSIQYLEAPIAVLAETARVLKPGGPVVISFSNRCFPTKAVAIWQALTDEAHLKLVGYFLEKAGFVGIEPRILVPKGQGFDPLFAVIGRTPT
jgi:SAM-dependent methyltransferase